MIEAQTSAVHYLPIATSLIAVGFVAALVSRCRLRGWPPYLTWWALGVVCYGSGTIIESIITLEGNSITLNRWWYLAGAILGAWPLATGSVYLVLTRRTANRLTVLSAIPVLVAAVAVAIGPMDPSQLEAHRPTGAVIGWQWIRVLTPFINAYAALFLVGGAVWSCHRFWGVPGQRSRTLGTALIAVGGILPGIGGSMAKAGTVEALYVAELVGLILIWAGYAACIRAPGSWSSSNQEAPTGQIG